MPWRDADEALLQRLVDEASLEALLAHVTRAHDVAVPPYTPRAAGLVAELRRRGDAPDVEDAPALAAYLERLELRTCTPELLHHLALHHATVARALETREPEAAAAAWMSSLAAWLALKDEGTYLAALEEAVLGKKRSDAVAPDRELLEDVAARADASARTLSVSGGAALRALARVNEATAGLADARALSLRAFAERRRNAAIDAALGVITEQLDEANVRGELTTAGPGILARALAVWSWSDRDLAASIFIVENIERIGWVLYRAASWEALRGLLAPFRAVIDDLAERIERDPSQIAYASVCAQMFVFASEVERASETKVALAERALRVCPTHRNGRLVLASYLCDQALATMRTMVVFARADDVARARALVLRVEELYPETKALAEAKTMLARVERGVRL